MTRLVLAALTSLIVVLGTPAAKAQGFGTYTRPPTSPYYRPAVSPYLNILTGNPGAGYYALTRPQMEAFRSIGDLQASLQLLQQGAASPTGLTALGGVPPGLGETGHATTFFYYSTYYTFPFPRYPGGAGGAPPRPTGTGSAFGSPPPTRNPAPTAGLIIGSP